MNRHEFFMERLENLGLYNNNSDYNGLIGKWVEELSRVFANQGHSGMSAEITLYIFDMLMYEWNTPSKITEQPTLYKSE